MAEEVKAPQLLGRSDKQGQFWLASWPKHCPLPFPLYLLPGPSSSSSTGRAMLHCLETSHSLQGRKYIPVLVGTFLLSVSASHPSYCCATVKTHLLTPSSLFWELLWPWGGPAGASILPYWLPSSGKQSPRTVIGSSCWLALMGSRPPSPGRHHQPPCPRFIPNYGNEQNPSLGDSQASKLGCDLKHKDIDEIKVKEMKIIWQGQIYFGRF